MCMLSVIHTMSGNVLFICQVKFNTSSYIQFLKFLHVLSSWGTKDQTGTATDLGVVSTTHQNQQTVEINIPTEQQDINALYEDACLELQKKVVEEKSHRDPRTKQED